MQPFKIRLHIFREIFRAHVAHYAAITGIQIFLVGIVGSGRASDMIMQLILVDVKVLRAPVNGAILRLRCLLAGA